MPADEDLLLPLEIPWKLASTTQPLETLGPKETSISLFVFEPDDENLTSEFPNEKLVYLKFTASISPCFFNTGNSRTAARFLGDALPVLHVMLEMAVCPGFLRRPRRP